MSQSIAHRPSITVAVPAWNSAATLQQTLLSLSEQRDVDVRVVVVDSGSTDGTLEICRRWNVECRYCPPGSMYAAINVGLRDARTEWVAYLNSDDWVYPNSYARLIAHGENTQAEFVYGHCDYSDAEGRFWFSYRACRPSEILPLFRLRTMGFAQQTTIYRRSLYQQLDGFSERYRYSADAEFYQRAALSGCMMERLDGASVAMFRLHPNQLTQTASGPMDAERTRLWQELGQAASWSDRLVAWRWKLGNWAAYANRRMRITTKAALSNPAPSLTIARAA